MLYLHEQIADQLREAIETGEYPPGAQLPSEVELIERFGVAHGTVRRALSTLREEGYVAPEQGRGVFVRAPEVTP